MKKFVSPKKALINYLEQQVGMVLDFAWQVYVEELGKQYGSVAVTLTLEEFGQRVLDKMKVKEGE